MANTPIMFCVTWKRGLAVGAIALALCPGIAAGAVDEDADKLLKSMSTYMGGLKAFSADVDIDYEIVQIDGQKLQLSSSGTVTVERPGKLHATRSGGLANVAFSLDGEMLTIYGKKLNAYVQVPAAGTLEDVATTLRNETELELPAADLLAANPYPGLMDTVTTGEYFGTAMVGGVEAHYLAFRAKQIDWQIWIKTGDDPVPLKYVITSKWTTGAPQYSIRFSNWNTAPMIDAAMFKFTPPEGARKLDDIPSSELGLFIVEEAK